MCTYFSCNFINQECLLLLTSESEFWWELESTQQKYTISSLLLFTQNDSVFFCF